MHPPCPHALNIFNRMLWVARTDHIRNTPCRFFSAVTWIETPAAVVAMRFPPVRGLIHLLQGELHGEFSICHTERTAFPGGPAATARSGCGSPDCPRRSGTASPARGGLSAVAAAALWNRGADLCTAPSARNGRSGTRRRIRDHWRISRRTTSCSTSWWCRPATAGRANSISSCSDAMACLSSRSNICAARSRERRVIATGNRRSVRDAPARPTRPGCGARSPR